MTTKRADAGQPPSDERRDSGRPGGGAGRTDVTGIVPDSVHVDPNVTEGHPGYQESGDSEISPPGSKEKR